MKDNKVAIVVGGGNDPEILSEVAKLGINTFLTGIANLPQSPANHLLEVILKNRGKWVTSGQVKLALFGVEANISLT